MKGDVLFYFYSFGNFDSGDCGLNLSFDIISQKDYTYPSKNISIDTKLNKNIIYNIQGELLSPSTFPSDEITLVVSTDENWNASEKDIPVNPI